MTDLKNYLIRDYREGDEYQISALFYEVFRKEMTIKHWMWKYAVPGEGRIYSKVVETASGRISGYAGAVPLRGMLDGKPIQFFQIADVMVHEKARGFFGKKNMFAEMAKSLFEDIGREFHEVFCYGFPGKRPYLVGERIGVYDTIEHGCDCLKDTGRSFPVGFYHIKPLSWDDVRIDIFWKHVSAQSGLALIRDQRYLLWRYAGHPARSYTLCGFFRFGRLEGWAVLGDGEDRVSIVDILCEPKKVLKFLRMLERHLGASGKKRIRLWLPEQWRKELKGYECRQTEIVVTNMIWKLPLKTSFVKERLFYTMGDVDIF